MGAADRSSTTTIAASSTAPAAIVASTCGVMPAQVGPFGDAVHQQPEADPGEQEAGQVEAARLVLGGWRRKIAPKANAAAPIGRLT